MIDTILECDIDERLSAFLKLKYLQDRKEESILIKPKLKKIIAIKRYWYDVNP